MQLTDSTPLITPVILCGGSGTRLWPLSRSAYPKQFISLLGEKSLLQQTLQRVDDKRFSPPILLANHEHRFLVSEQTSEIINEATILLEPQARNTAAAIVTASEFVLKNQSSETSQWLLVLPSDHYIADTEAFQATVTQAVANADADNIIIFGIKPTHPETGYGYIKCLPKKFSSTEALTSGLLAVDRFVEKPDATTATDYISSGDYYWNAGMFLFQPQTLIDEMRKFQPNIVELCQQAVDTIETDLNFHKLGEPFTRATNISIDYALMEHTEKSALVPLNAGWSDIGSFTALAQLHPKDTESNVQLAETITIDSQNNFIYANDKRIVGTVGVNDTLIIDTDDALLVAHKDHAQRIGEVVKQLKANNDERATLHKRAYRPWGWYEPIAQGDGFQVKRIHVKSGAALSLQKHRYRSEHWIVIKGTATVQCDNDILKLATNESTFIPLGAVHRLTNETSEDLQIIEVQNGSYLGEDDIIRLEDDYQRT